MPWDSKDAYRDEDDPQLDGLQFNGLLPGGGKFHVAPEDGGVRVSLFTRDNDCFFTEVLSDEEALTLRKVLFRKGMYRGVGSGRIDIERILRDEERRSGR